MSRPFAVTPGHFTDFGDLLKFLRRRAGLSQRELSSRVGYSVSQISRLEKNRRTPDPAAIAARFVPALDLENEPEWVTRLLELAAGMHVANDIESGQTARHLAPHNVPIQFTSFIGREQELEELGQMLAGKDRGEQVRLVTLTGAGGSGKTRLAQRVGTDLSAAGRFHDGVWWVELSPLQNPELVPQVATGALGLREAPNESFLETLTNFLRTRRLLLILDNCEHLVAAASHLAHHLLTHCPDLKILATSRETLSIDAEQVFPVPLLSLPDSGQTQNVAEMGRADAIRLFVERAQAVKPEFSLTGENAGAVLQVCARLDGIPLAIELAATRVRMMTVEQIAARLDDRFQLLTSGSRTVLPRHQTLRATIGWSYDLLTGQEKILFQRLAVFAGEMLR